MAAQLRFALLFFVIGACSARPYYEDGLFEGGAMSPCGLRGWMRPVASQFLLHPATSMVGSVAGGFPYASTSMVTGFPCASSMVGALPASSSVVGAFPASSSVVGAFPAVSSMVGAFPAAASQVEMAAASEYAMPAVSPVVMPVGRGIVPSVVASPCAQQWLPSVGVAGGWMHPATANHVSSSFSDVRPFVNVGADIVNADVERSSVSM